MILTIIKKTSEVNRLKFTLTVFWLIAVNLFTTFSVSAAESTPPPTSGFSINLKICIKDENDQPATKKSGDGKAAPVSFTIVGGSEIIKLQSDPSGCAEVAEKYKFTNSKEYVILVSTQNENGVRMTARYFDPALYKAGIKETPTTLNLKIKDGISVQNNNGDEVFYSKSLAGTGNSVPDNIANTGNSDNSNNTGNANAASNINQSDPKSADSSWSEIIALLSLLALTLLIIHSIVRRPAPTFQSGGNLLDRQSFLNATSNFKKEVIEAINNKSFESKIEGLKGKTEPTLPSGIPKSETESYQGKGEETASFEAQKTYPQRLADTTFAGGLNDLQTYDAQTYYTRFKEGANIPYIELQPTGETSPEYMLANQGIKLSEQSSGKYIAFPIKDKLNETWVFPAPNLRFSETIFSLVFPELTKENYESGNITPKKAIKQNNSGTWLIK